jgi:hypothetical protein
MPDWMINSSNDFNSISKDPRFVDADAAYPDMHLKSTADSYHNGQWLSDVVDSPCLDAGDPEASFSAEPWYNGLTRNIGAYGNTPQASKTFYDGAFFNISFDVEPTNTVGSVDVWPGSHIYPTNRLIRATVIENYPAANPFMYWTNGWSGTNLVTEFFATNHISPTAVFFVPSITSDTSVGGSIYPFGTIMVVGGTNVTYTIAPTNAAFILTNVLVDAELVGSNLVWTFPSVISNHTIRALFEEWSEPTITASVGPGGSISPIGDVIVIGGTNVTFTIAPLSEDYFITNLVVDLVLQGSNDVWTFTSVIEDHTIHALFGSLTPPATTNGTPLTWLEFHGFTSEHQAADDADQDSDGFYTWQEFVLGTDPNDSASAFVLYSSIVGGTWIVSFPSIEATGIGYGAADTDERRYSIEERTDLLTGDWVPVPDPNYTNILGNGVDVVYTNESSRLYYRAKARLE